RRRRVVVHFRARTGAWLEPTHRAACPRVARARRQGTSIRTRAGAPLGDASPTWIHDGVVTPGIVADRLGSPHGNSNRSTYHETGKHRSRVRSVPRHRGGARREA